MSGYSLLQPLRDEMCGSPSARNIIRLREALATVQPETQQLMMDYLLKPLLILLDGDPKIITSTIKVHLLDTITTLLRSTNFQQLVPFKVLLIAVLKQIFDPITTTVHPNLSEELKLSALGCLESAFMALSFDTRPQFYATPASSFQLAQVVFATLHLLQHDRYNRIRQQAIDTLLAICSLHDAADACDAELRLHCAQCLCLMLPKITSVLLQCIDGDDKQPQPLRVRALQALSRYICLIFEDYEKAGDPVQEAPSTEQFSALFSKHSPPKTAEANANVLDVVQLVRQQQEDPNQFSGRSAAWLEAAIKRIQPLFERLLKSTASQSSPIRQQLATFATRLFSLVRPGLRSHLGACLQIILAMSRDEDAAIAEPCRLVLRSLQSAENGEAFGDQLDAMFHKLVLQAPRVLATGSDRERFALLRLLVAVVHGGARMRLVLASGDALQRFGELVLFALQLESGGGENWRALREGNRLQLEFQEATGGEQQQQQTPWRRYAHLDDGRVATEAELLCREVGQSAAADAVFEWLLGRMRERRTGSDEALLAMVLLVAGDGWAEMERCQRLLTELINGTEHWDLDVRPVTGTTSAANHSATRPSDWYEDRTPGLYESAISVRYTDMAYTAEADASSATAVANLSIAEARANIQHLALCLEAIGRLARTLRQLYQPFLLRSLFRILVQTGSRNELVRSAGHFALTGIAAAFDQAHIADLIAANFDYICHAVAMALRRERESADALQMLTVLLRYAPLEAVPQWRAIVDTVLEASARSVGGGEERVLQFVQLFARLLEHLERHAVEAGSGDGDRLKVADDAREMELRLRAEWLAILSAAEVDFSAAEMADDDEANGGDAEAADAGDESEPPSPPPPPSVQITVEILRRCIHYLPHKTRTVQCQSLDTWAVGVRVLRLSAPGDNVVLPLVHEVWRPFVERVRGGDAVVVRRCFALMLELAEVAKDFIYKRTVSDVFPLVLGFLKKAATESRERVRDASFENSQIHRLTVELFAALPPLIQRIGVDEPDLDSLLDASLPFLSAVRHRTPLQRVARQFLGEVCAIDAAAVYAKLIGRTACAEIGVNVRQILRETRQLAAC